MEPQELLEALVSVVAALGEVAATETGSHRDMQQRVSPKSLNAALRRFSWHLHRTLDHGGVPSLGQALATLGASPGATWADVRATGRAWLESVAALMESWGRLTREAAELRDACEDAANTEATAATQAGDPRDEVTRRGTAGDNVAATAQWLPMALDRQEMASVGAAHKAQGAVATNEAVGEAVVAASWVRAATRRGHWVEVALGPLKRLVATCDRARLFLLELQCWLRDIQATLEETEEAFPDIPEALVAKVAKFERLWRASTLLFTCHLLGTLGDIHNLLLSLYDDPGGLSGPGSCVVAKRCQRAIEDIPRLLQGQ